MDSGYLKEKTKDQLLAIIQKQRMTINLQHTTIEKLNEIIAIYKG